MKPAVLIEELAERDIHLSVNGDQLHIDAPKGALTEDLLQELRANKPHLMTFLSTSLCNQDKSAVQPNVPTTSRRPFDQPAMDAIKAGKAVAIWSTVLNDRLWWVKGKSERRNLEDQGCKEVIYTLGELAVVAGYPPNNLKEAHELKKQFGAIINPDKT